ncbi:MAG: M14 family metallopeptidase [Saprospiraceae bacterium]
MMYRYTLLLLIVCQTALSCQTPRSKGETYDPPNSTDTRTKEVEYQERKTYQIQNIYLSNEFDGGRLSYARDGGLDTVIALITPENAPINKSAWFAFKIWSDETKRVMVKLEYQDGEHRYIPKISEDGENWTKIQKSRFKRDKENVKFAWLEIEVSPTPKWIAGQELMTSKHIFSWMDDIASQKSYVTTKDVGESRLDAPMRLMKIADTDAKNTILLFGRQHPPEVTGQIAMHTFIETLLEDNELANEFRSKFQVYAFPLMNPDGVDQGHWRHNTGGIDLNRDWWKFRQPEIKRVTKFLKKEMRRKKFKVWYGFDFHSTGADVLYPTDKEIIGDKESITYPWIKNMKERLPRDEWVVEPFDISSPICKNWIFRTFDAEAITYEVGDEVARDYVQLKAKIAAEEMMKILIKRLEE